METELLSMIGSLGFPIVACCYLFYALNQEREEHKHEVNELAKVIEANTQVLTEMNTIIKWWLKGGNSE